MTRPVSELLLDARQDLFVAVKLSRQGAYHRRAPSSESLPHYGEAKRLLKEVLQHEPGNCQALLMMSQIAEGLMDFSSAINFLNDAFAAGEPRSKKHLKRLALLKENSKTWRKLVLTPEELRELGEFLQAKDVSPANRSLDYTKQWLNENYQGNPQEVLNSFDEVGAFSDFQVLANVVYG